MNQRLLAEIGRTQRLEIVNALKRSRGLSVNELVDRMRMSYMGIKQHCLTLQRDGYLDTWRRPQKMGRPEMVYRLTRRTQDLFQADSNRFTLELLDSVQDNKYDDAVNALDRFIQLHPGNPDAVYAYYLKGLCYYEQIVDVGRDQRVTELALETLSEVVTRYPNTPYARDARLKVELAIDHLAGKEMAVGRYYQANSQYIGAINRYRVVIERYQTTTHVPEALHRLVESYLSPGVKSEAQEAAAVLGYNFPGSDWYQDSYYLMTGEGTPAPVDERRWFFGLF
jgi:outer membrane assembly lipoprotein YfiO